MVSRDFSFSGEIETHTSTFTSILSLASLLFNSIVCQSHDAPPPPSTNLSPNPIVQLSVYPSSGVALDNIEIRCQMTLSSSSSASTSNYDNAYLSVRTDDVRPSGILLMLDHYSNNCRINRAQYLQVEVCNRSLILIRINHTLLNASLHKIDYWCNKGEVNAFSSYRITSNEKKNERTTRRSSLITSICLEGHHTAAKYHHLASSSSSSSSVSASTFVRLRWILCTVLLHLSPISDKIRWLTKIS